MIFKNREYAGKKLGWFLETEYGHQNPIILGISEGGMEVAYYVAQQLHAELSFIVSRRLPLPNNKEYAFGAILEDHSVYVSPETKDILDQETINAVIDQQKQEVDRRVFSFRQGKPLPDVKGRVVILIDEGIVTGMTLVPAIRFCRKEGASKIVVAAPVAGKSYDKNLKEADDIKIFIEQDEFFGIAQAYEQFDELNDEKVKDILLKAEIERVRN